LLLKSNAGRLISPGILANLHGGKNDNRQNLFTAAAISISNERIDDYKSIDFQMNSSIFAWIVSTRLSNIGVRSE